MEIVQILCCENTEWLHKIGVWAIEKSERTNFNHVAILLKDDYGVEWVYEAVFPRARKMRFAEWIKKFKIIKSYNLPLYKYEYFKFITTVHSQIGKPYSIFQCFLIWISNSVGVLEHYIESTLWNGNKSLICSEFVARPIVAAIGFEFENDLDSIGMDEIEFCLNKIAKELTIHDS
jgi:hypothetical protein